MRNKILYKFSHYILYLPQVLSIQKPHESDHKNISDPIQAPMDLIVALSDSESKSLKIKHLLKVCHIIQAT
jgi:hypothetical protein